MICYVFMDIVNVIRIAIRLHRAAASGHFSAVDHGEGKKVTQCEIVFHVI